MAILHFTPTTEASAVISKLLTNYYVDEGGERASYQDGAPGRRLQAGQAAGQHGSVAALRIVLQGDAVWLRVLHDQARVVGMRQAGVQVAPWRIHRAGPKPEVQWTRTVLGLTIKTVNLGERPIVSS